MIALIVSSGEPDYAKFPYAGWVPTANGHLSFRHIGEARHPTESIYANITTKDQRIVLGYQRRPLSDVLFQWMIHYFCDIEGSFWFVLAARSGGPPGDTEDLLGKIYIYKSKADWREKGQPVVRGSIIGLNDIRLSFGADQHRNVERLFTLAQEKLNVTADIEIAFHLNRSGEVYFSKPLFQVEDLEYASVDYAKHTGHDFSKWVADQSYFFLRDMSHVHQHHSPTSDTILTLQERHKDDCVIWRRNIVFSLHHYIIRSKRFRDAKSVLQAVGVLGYCMSFLQICKDRIGDEAKKIPIFNDAAMIQSLKARSDEENERATTAIIKITKAGNVRSYILILSAILLAILVMFVQPAIDANKFEKLTIISEFLAEYIMPAFLAMFVFGAVCWAIAGRSWRPKRPFARDLLEVSNVRRTRSIIVFAVAALVVLMIGIVLAWTAVIDVSRAVMALARILLW